MIASTGFGMETAQATNQSACLKHKQSLEKSYLSAEDDAARQVILGKADKLYASCDQWFPGGMAAQHPFQPAIQFAPSAQPVDKAIAEVIAYTPKSDTWFDGLPPDQPAFQDEEKRAIPIWVWIAGAGVLGLALLRRRSKA